MRHKPTKPLKVMDGGEESCGRLRALLGKAFDVIMEAQCEDFFAMGAGKPGSFRHLSAAVSALRLLTRPRPDTPEWHGEIDHYLRREPHLRWVDDIPPQDGAEGGAR